MKTLFKMALTIFLCLVSSLSLAAFCSLREPVTAINTLMPLATHHRSIVKTVSNTSRNYVRNRLPFDMHFNEIGRHTLYIAFKDEMPFGIVHSRSEASDWGLIEFAWALDFDYRVTNFFFQRCRSRQCNDTLKNKIVGDLSNKSFDEVKKLLNDDGSELIPALQDKYGDDGEIVKTAIVSALKTIALTRSEWQFDVDNEIENYLINKAKVTLNLDASPILESLEGKASISSVQELSKQGYIDLESVKLYRVIDDTERARIVTSRWLVGDKTSKLVLLFDNYGVLKTFGEIGMAISDESNDIMNSLVGKGLRAKEECESITELVSSALYTLLSSSQSAILK